MTIIILLIAISLSIATLFLIIFFWNMKTGQYDDTYTPSVRMLFDNSTGMHSTNQPDEPDGCAVTHDPGRQVDGNHRQRSSMTNVSAGHNAIPILHSTRCTPSGRMLFQNGGK